MTRKEERRYTPEELAETYQGAKAKFERPEGTGKLETCLASSTRRAAWDYVKDQWHDHMDHPGKGEPTRPRDMEKLEQACYADGDARHVSIKKSFVEEMVRDGYLIPRKTTLERQWQKRRDAHLAKQERPDGPVPETNQGRGGRS